MRASGKKNILAEYFFPRNVLHLEKELTAKKFRSSANKYVVNLSYFLLGKIEGYSLVLKLGLKNV